MALISAKTILTSVALFHLSMAFFLLTKPGVVADQALVWLLGESMSLADTPAFDEPSAPLGLLAVVLAFFGLADLVSLSLPDEIGLVYHWGAQAPARVLFALLWTLYAFFFGPSSPLYSPPSRAAGLVHVPLSSSSSSGSATGSPSHNVYFYNANYTPAAWGGEVLKNRLFFTFMFVETAAWFWAWVTLREERSQIIERETRKRP